MAASDEAGAPGGTWHRQLWIRAVEAANPDDESGTHNREVREVREEGTPIQSTISPTRLFPTPEKPRGRGMVGDALVLCDRLQKLLGRDVLSVPVQTHYSHFSTRATVLTSSTLTALPSRLHPQSMPTFSAVPWSQIFCSHTAPRDISRPRPPPTCSRQPPHSRHHTEALAPSRLPPRCDRLVSC